MSDEHNKRVLGSHGHPMIQKPNLDRLAARGTFRYSPPPGAKPAYY